MIGALIFHSCTSQRKSGENEKPVITVSILPQKTFVEKIAGNDFDIQVLVPHGASPESYTLVPRNSRIFHARMSGSGWVISV